MIRKVKISTVGSFADYGEYDFPGLIFFHLGCIFLSKEFSIPKALNLSEKLEPR